MAEAILYENIGKLLAGSLEDAFVRSYTRRSRLCNRSWSGSVCKLKTLRPC